MGISENNKNCTALIFTYGTLKTGFPNHKLIQDLFRTGDAVFKGAYRTTEKYPLVCGPFRVPFLLNIPGSGNQVTGELYSVSNRGLERMDELEGTTRGHYQRLPVQIVPAGDREDICGDDQIGAEAYYAHVSYDKELWRKNRGKGFGSYSEKEACGYVKRNDRPQGISFLDHIRNFLSSSD